MNKLFLVILCLCTICIIMTAEVKVALVPTAPELAPVADQALVAMSNDPGVEFLERTDIETILKERNLTAAGLTGTNLIDLSKTIHADIFAVITAKSDKKGAAISGLIVYDARNGFRLVNATLSEQDAVKDIVERLRRAQEILKHPEKQILLSIATVRDAGVPERFKYQQAFIAADLERRLGGIPNVIVLERDYLDSVNQERKITGQMFKLAPSARLLRLEFSPGSSPEIVNLILRVTDAADKELFRFNLDDCLTDPKATAMKTIAAIAEYLKISLPSITVSASDEAARFFAEYQFFSRLGDYAAARRKLDAAIALEPKKLEYRLAMLDLNRLRPSRYSFHKLVDTLVLNLQLANEIKCTFPNSEPYCDDIEILYDLYNRLREATPDEMAVLSQWGDEYRPHLKSELRQRFYKFDLTDGINSYAELWAYRYFCRQCSRYFLYFDNKKWCDNLYKTALENMQFSRDFFLKHPELCTRDNIRDEVSDWMDEFQLTLGMVYGNSKGCIDIKTPAEQLLLNSKEYVDLALRHPRHDTRIKALEVELWLKTIESHYDEAALKRNVLEYCRQAAAIDADALANSPEYSPQLPSLIPDFDKSKLDNFILQLKRDFISNNLNTKKVPMETLFANVNQSKSLQERARKVLELAPELLQYKTLIWDTPMVRDFFYLSIGEPLYRQNTLESKAALAVMNHDITINTLFSFPDNNNGQERIIRNALFNKDYIYLLFNNCESNRKTWSIARLAINTGKITMLISQIVDAEFTFGKRLQPFSISEKTAIAAGDNCILVFHLDSGHVKVIEDLPGKKVMAVTILGNRIYAFTGEEEKVGGTEAHETILFSCDFNGKDRRIHISTSRENKKNMFDREKPFKVYNMVADECKKRLLFVVCANDREDGLWEFIPATEAGSLLVSEPGNLIEPYITVVDNMLFFSFFFDNHYSYDILKDNIDLVFSISNPVAKYYLKCKSGVGSRRGAMGYYGPFFTRPGQIWFGGSGEIKLLTLPDISKSPLILLPDGRLSPGSSRLLFPHPDGKSAISIDERNIYKITPKESAK